LIQLLGTSQAQVIIRSEIDTSIGKLQASK
jgi:hypothetical protein